MKKVRSSLETKKAMKMTSRNPVLSVEEKIKRKTNRKQQKHQKMKRIKILRLQIRPLMNKLLKRRRL